MPRFVLTIFGHKGNGQTKELGVLQKGVKRLVRRSRSLCKIF